MPDADQMGRQAAAASEKVKEGVKESVKSVVSEAAQVVKSVAIDTDEDGAEHDEL